MQNDEIIATIEQGLRQTNTQKQSLENRLQEVENEALALRAEIEALGKIATQAEEAIVTLLSASRTSRGATSRQNTQNIDNGELLPRRNSREDERQTQNYQAPQPNYQNLANPTNTGSYPNNNAPNYPNQNYPNNTGANYPNQNYPNNPAPNYGGQNAPNYPNQNYPTQQNTNVVSMHQRNFRHHIPPINFEVRVQDNRFAHATITQACVVLLREAGDCLHVNELYNRLLEGGFMFTGNNPTISIAVSLTRNRHFRKVAPGTFELSIIDTRKYAQ